MKYLLEADFLSDFSEASSADHHAVFSDKTLSSTADSALTGALAVVSWM